VLVCVLLAAGIARGPVSAGTIIVAIGALCLSAAILSYRVEVDSTEVRVRYLPFYTKCTPIRDITHLAEERTLVLVTATAKIPLWGLSTKAREPLFEILSPHLDVVPTLPNRRTDSAAVVRRHVRWTILAGVGFAATARSGDSFPGWLLSAQLLGQCWEILASPVHGPLRPLHFRVRIHLCAVVQQASFRQNREGPTSQTHLTSQFWPSGIVARYKFTCFRGLGPYDEGLPGVTPTRTFRDPVSDRSS
jgi:hypothetical protein